VRKAGKTSKIAFGLKGFTIFRVGQVNRFAKDFALVSLPATTACLAGKKHPHGETLVSFW